jgi:hypothetical protein
VFRNEMTWFWRGGPGATAYCDIENGKRKCQKMEKGKRIQPPSVVVPTTH